MATTKQDREFNATLRKLREMRKANQTRTVEYVKLCEKANRLNPNPHTPIGFYLDD